jgi:F-type H+-transporting ATPase subunit b
MININATLFLQIIHFLILLFILNRILIRPIMKVVEKRRVHIDDEEKLLNNLEEETRELMDKCASIERDARKKALEESSLLKKEANDTVEEFYEAAKNEISGIIDQADKEIDIKIDEARKTLEDFATDLAGELTEKVIGRRFAS